MVPSNLCTVDRPIEVFSRKQFHSGLSVDGFGVGHIRGEVVDNILTLKGDKLLVTRCTDLKDCLDAGD